MLEARRGGGRSWLADDRATFSGDDSEVCRGQQMHGPGDTVLRACMRRGLTMRSLSASIPERTSCRREQCHSLMMCWQVQSTKPCARRVMGAKALRAEKQGQRDCEVMGRRLQARRLGKTKNVLRQTMSVLCISPRSPSLLDACRHLEELPGAFANQLSKYHCLRQRPVRPAAGRCEAPDMTCSS